MVADYFTKPLQGALFYKFRDQIMGLVPMGTITGDHRSVLDKKSPPAKNLNTAREDAQHNGARIKAKTSHDSKSPASHISWADVVKSRPLRSPKTPLTQLG